MAVGDQTDILGRLKSVLPNGWFKDSTPVLDGLLSGLAYALAQIYGLIGYAQLQTRISSATDGFLDIISYDFFGLGLPRKQSELDAPFRSRILANLLREKATRNGMIQTLLTLTGVAPTIFEPNRPLDTGVYNNGTMGYNVAGLYGSPLLPWQAFITAHRPLGAGIPNVSGYGVSTGAYNTGSQLRYSNPSMIVGNVTDADIYAAITAAKPDGTIMWTAIS